MGSEYSGVRFKTTDQVVRSWEEGQAQGCDKCAVSLGPITEHAGPWLWQRTLLSLFCDFTNWEFPKWELEVIWPEVGSDRGLKEIRGSQTKTQGP